MASAKKNGAQNNRVDIPHTYYFTTNYFNKTYKEVLLNDTFKGKCDGELYNWRDRVTTAEEGEVIRFLGRLEIASCL